MKYVVIDAIKSGDIYTEEFNTADEALDYAEREWSRLSRHDQARRESYIVLASVNPDEDAEDHFDGDVVKDFTEVAIKDVQGSLKR